jgi:C-terminal processing protease CtpA/Prc
MILEPYEETAPPFEFDMSGMFLASDAPGYAKIRILSANPKTPAAEAGLQTGDEIVSIDGRKTPRLTLDEARALLREPVARRLEIRRGDQLIKVRLEARRLV